MPATILHFRTIASKVRKLSEEKRTKESSAFLELCMGFLFPDFSEDDITDGIIDGGGDLGIDAIYIIEDSEPKKVYLIQSKYYENENKFGRAFVGSALSKMRDSISRLILSRPKKIHEANRFLLDKLQDIRRLSNPKYHIVFCSNSEPPTSEARKDFQNFLDEKGGDQYFEVEYLCLSEIMSYLAPETTRKINTKIPLRGKYFDWSVGSARVVVGRMQGIELAKLREQEGKELFDRNVRDYLSHKNPVNKEILRAASDSNIAPNFFLLNNGITMVCTKLEYLPIDEGPEIKVENLQIVNGGQTTNALYEAYSNNLLSDKAYVLTRIVQTENKELLKQITEATNTQTRVSTRDLRSNDLIQRQIEQTLLNVGYFYEARKNKYRDNPSARGKRIDAEVAAQAYYAFSFRKPADAKNKKRELFGSLYDEIFTDTINPSQILLAFRVLEYIRKSHGKLKKQYGFVKYAEYHSIAMIGDLGIRSIEELRKPRLYRNILLATAEVVAEEVKSKGDDYSHRLLFIDPATFGRIKEAYIDKLPLKKL